MRFQLDELGRTVSANVQYALAVLVCRSSQGQPFAVYHGLPKANIENNPTVISTQTAQTITMPLRLVWVLVPTGGRILLRVPRPPVPAR